MIDVQDAPHIIVASVAHNDRAGRPAETVLATAIQPGRGAGVGPAHRPATDRSLRVTASVVTHGIVSTYTNRRCRCEPCRTASRDYIRAYRGRRRTVPALAPPGG